MRGWTNRNKERLNAARRERTRIRQAAPLTAIEVAALATNLAGEEWRPVVGYKGVYEVSSYGRIRSMRRANTSWIGRILNTKSCRKGGYHSVMLGSPRKSFSLHAIVARSFHGDPPAPRYEVNHRDNNPDNNRADNLEWVTRSENLRHAYRTNGRRAPRQKLTADQVREIRARTSETGVALAAAYSVSTSTISLIRLGKIFHYV